MNYEFLVEKYLRLFNEQNNNPGTIAMVPGSFKPPHSGHFTMIEYFSFNADKVYVIISDPQSEKSIRRTPAGKKITAQNAREILEIYCSKLNNVEFIVSSQPVKWVYDFVKDDTTSGQKVLLGVSGKGEDAKRYSNAQKYAPDGVNVESVIFNDSDLNISASDFRDVIDNPTFESIIPFLPYHLTETEISSVLNILRNITS